MQRSFSSCKPQFGAGVVSMVITLWLDNSDSNLGRRSIRISAPERKDRLWGPSILIFNGYRGSPWGKLAGA